MLGLQSCRRRRALNRIKPVQLLRVFAPLRILANQLMKAGERRARKKIRIERNNHVCIGQIVLNIQSTLDRAVPAIAGSYCTSVAFGYFACTAFHCRASVGEVIVSLRK